MTIPLDSPSRRELLAALGTALIRPLSAAGPPAKILRGIFPIAQTPFTTGDKLDLDSLRAQVAFLDRGGAHGIVWPQLASEWSTLSEAERMEGAEALLEAGRKLRPAVVIGVQSGDPGATARLAKHAAQHGADALIALPPAGVTQPQALLDYYREIGRTTDLPLFAQAVGAMSVEFLLEMVRAVPTLRYVKDEAGEPLMRIGPLREKTRDELKIFTGAHGRTLIDEMARGSSGTMPAVSFADLYAVVWDHWQAGRRREAMEAFGKVLMFVTEVQVYGIESLKYILYLRGVFKTYHVRPPGASGPAAGLLNAGGLGGRGALDDEARRLLREMVEVARPWFRA